jgi:hypothetical protein
LFVRGLAADADLQLFFSLVDLSSTGEMRNGDV